MTENIDQWKTIKSMLLDALPAIDEYLNEINVPLSRRSTQAFDVIQKTMLEVSDWEAFMLSPVHGQFHVLISNWYQKRYGRSAVKNDDRFFSHALIHGMPFPMAVPKNFRIPDEDPKLQWIGFPASVQSEENCLQWIDGGPEFSTLSEEDHESLSAQCFDRANYIRSIGFDLHALEHDTDAAISGLAASVRSNLEGASRYLCQRRDSDLRHAGSEISQALEKALKLFLRRNGQTPPRSHDLAKLATLAETEGLYQMDRSDLEKIPSGSNAASIRYEGEIQFQLVVDAYDVALAIIARVVEACTPKSEINVREARFQIKTPPWFEFDQAEFLDQLNAEAPSGIEDEAS